MSRPSTRLSPTQIDTLRHAVSAPLERLPGGFWTPSDCAVGSSGVPEWSVSIQTIRALESKGLLLRVGLTDEWRDPRFISEAGRAALAGEEVRQ